MIAPSTITRYTKALRALAKALEATNDSFIADHETILAWIENQTCLSSKKVFLCALIFCINDNPDLVLDMPNIFHVRDIYRERLRLYSAQQRCG